MKKSIYDQVKKRIVELGLMEEKMGVTQYRIVLAILETDKREGGLVSVTQKYRFDGDFAEQSDEFGRMILSKIS